MKKDLRDISAGYNVWTSDPTEQTMKRNHEMIREM